MDDDISPVSNDEGAENTSEVSPASGSEGEKETSILDVINASLGESSEGSPASDSDSEKADGSEDASDPAKAQAEKDAKAEDEEELGDVTPEELKGYHSKTRRRVKQLLDERDAAREETEGLREKASGFDQIVEHITSQGLSAEELDAAVNLQSLLKRAQSDPAAAREALQHVGKYVQTLQTATGDILPPDLQTQVDQGFISPDLAKELAAHRQGSQMAERSNAQRQAQEAQRQAQANIGEVSSVVGKWEAGWQSRDADYAVKQPLVQSHVKAALSEAVLSGRMVTAAEASQICEDALKAANATLAKLNPPKPKAADPGFATGGTSRASAEPKTMMEAIDRGLAMSRG